MALGGARPGAGRKKGTKARQMSTLEHLTSKCCEVATRWINDPDENKAREGLKVLLPYILARKQEVTGPNGGAIRLTFSSVDQRL